MARVRGCDREDHFYGPDLDDMDEELRPTYYGPSWRRHSDGSWCLPEKTLGWALAGWATKYLASPRGDGPWRFTNEQLRWLLWWYAVDENGDFIFTEGIYQRLKGSGKDAIAAVVAWIEALAPCRFSHWDENGEPVGIPVHEPIIQVTAVSQSQTGNTHKFFNSTVTKALTDTYGVVMGRELIRALDGSVQIVMSASSYRAIEGKQTTFGLANEIHHWVQGNNGHDLMDTMIDNLTKTKGRLLSISNAYLPGEDSVLERKRADFMKILEGRLTDTGLLYDSVEASSATDLSPETLKKVIPLIRGDAVWLDPDFIINRMQGLASTNPARARRMWLNQIVATSESLISPLQVQSITDPSLVLRPGDRITMGFDGGKTDDATALVAYRMEDKAFFVLGVWEAPEGEQGRDWQVPRQEVDSVVHMAFRKYKVAAFFADVSLWEAYIDNWSRDYGSQLEVRATQRECIAWDMRSNIANSTKAHGRLLSAIFEEEVRIEDHMSLHRHMLNAVRHENKWGVSFRKRGGRESSAKVDLYAAMLIAFEAAHQLHLRGKPVRAAGAFYGF